MTPTWGSFHHFVSLPLLLIIGMYILVNYCLKDLQPCHRNNRRGFHSQKRLNTKLNPNIYASTGHFLRIGRVLTFYWTKKQIVLSDMWYVVSTFQSTELHKHKCDTTLKSQEKNRPRCSNNMPSIPRQWLLHPNISCAKENIQQSKMY